MILLIDNYDSFSYNLYQLVGSLCPAIRVVRNDQMTVEEIRAAKPEALILSPGPGKPRDAGICGEAVKKLAGEIPILGVCLGHQVIYEAFGGTVDHAKGLMHGKQSSVRIDRDSPLFAGLPETIKVARYHSLAGTAESLPKALKVTAVTPEGEIMAVEHKSLPVYGLQFHPESIMTPDGPAILRNFVFRSGRSIC